MSKKTTKVIKSAPKELNALKDPYSAIASPSQICCKEDHVRRKNCTKNPWCLFGLGERRDGVWSKNIEQCLAVLGSDPSPQLRAEVTTPHGRALSPPCCGLKNLGATCYLNVLIQSIFHNLLLRDAVLNMVATVAANHCCSSSASGSGYSWLAVVQALQTAFAHMQYSRNGQYDLRDFVERLGLNCGEQQDPQEFSKLLVAGVEGLGLTRHSKAHASLGDLLCGEERYCTTCAGCGAESEQRHQFHELELSVGDHRTLETALAAHLGAEQLTGDNQYECRKCCGKRDATRRTELQRLPAVLSFHLLRYTYDRKTYEKQKLQTDLSFPATIEVCGEQFRLTAVLYHKGRSAHGGHYVCEVLDWASGDWWHCDDQIISRCSHPAVSSLAVVQDLTEIAPSTETADEEEDEAYSETSGVAGKKSKSAQRGKGSNKKRKTGGEGVGSSSSPIELTEAPVKAPVNRKRDAYMLTYVRARDFDAGLAANRAPPPTSALDSVTLASDEFAMSVAGYVACKQRVAAFAERRRGAYHAIESQLTPVHDVAQAGGDVSFNLVPTEALTRWLTGLPLEAVAAAAQVQTVCAQVDVGADEFSVRHRCEHGRGLLVADVERFKVLSHDAFSAIVDESPHMRREFLGFNSVNFRCHECFTTQIGACSDINATARRVAALVEALEASAAAEERRSNGSANEANSSGGGEAELSMRVSRTWWTALRRLYTSLVNSLEGRGKRSPQEVLAALLSGAEVPVSSGADRGSPPPAAPAVEIVDLCGGGGTIDEWVTGAAESSSSSSAPLDGRVNETLVCPHGAASARKQFLTVSAAVWRQLVELFPLAVPLAAGAPSCALCEKATAEEVQNTQARKSRRKLETDCACLSALSKSRRGYPAEFDQEELYSPVRAADGEQLLRCQTDTHFLVAAAWLDKWRLYLKNVDIERPSLDALLSTEIFLCKHRLAVVPNLLSGIADGVPPVLVAQSSQYQSVSVSTGELISGEQFRQLTRFGLSSNGDAADRAAVVDVDAPVAIEADDSSGLEALAVRLQWSPEHQKWQWLPECCISCRTEGEQLAALSNVNFHNKRIQVVAYTDEQKLVARLTGSQDGADGVVLSSSGRPARRCRGTGCKSGTVTLSSEDAVALAKMKIYESFAAMELPPLRQRLFSAAGTELTGAQQTLSAYGVQASETLFVLLAPESEGAEDGDDAAFMGLWSQAQARAPESGFGGSLLTGSATNRSTASLVISCDSPTSGAAQSATDNFAQRIGDVGDEDAAFQRELQRAIRESAEQQLI